MKHNILSLILLFIITATSQYTHAQTWELIWQDEFNTDGKYDTDKWQFAGRKASAWSKYCTDAPELASVTNGNLVITGRVTSQEQDTIPFQTGCLCTKSNFSFTYGKVEIRARFTMGKGAWPALWMMPESSVYGGWPHSGEIDIMEHLNKDKIVYQTIHTTYTRGEDQKSETVYSHATAPIQINDYNIYGIEWYPNRIEFYTNGIKTFTYSKMNEFGSRQYPFDQPFYLIVNQALGGDWVGKIDAQDLPVAMSIDWIRVYQDEEQK